MDSVNFWSHGWSRCYFHRVGDHGSEEWLAVKKAVNDASRWGATKVGSYRHGGTHVATKVDANNFKRVVVDQRGFAACGHSRRVTSAGQLGARFNAVQTQPQLASRCKPLLTELVVGTSMETAPGHDQ